MAAILEYHLKIWIYNHLQWSQKSPSNSFSANHSKKIKKILNFEYVTAILDPLFWIFKVWLQNRHYRPHKPPTNSSQINYSKRIQNSLKYCMRYRHIGSAILNFSSFRINYSKRIQNSLKYCMRGRHIRSAILNFVILTSDSQSTIPKTLEMTCVYFATHSQKTNAFW